LAERDVIQFLIDTVKSSEIGLESAAWSPHQQWRLNKPAQQISGLTSNSVLSTSGKHESGPALKLKTAFQTVVTFDTAQCSDRNNV